MIDGDGEGQEDRRLARRSHLLDGTDVGSGGKYCLDRRAKG